VTPFTFATDPLIRRHGPQGYADYKSYKPWLRDEFTFRCAYCWVRERFIPSGHRYFGVDHIIPQSTDPSRVCDYENLSYACEWCNSVRQDVPLALDPFSDTFSDHLLVKQDGALEPLTPRGHAHIQLFRLDRPEPTQFRALILRIVRSLADKADEESMGVLQYLLSYPDDLPNLLILRPLGNTRPSGVADCCFARRQQGTLSATY